MKTLKVTDFDFFDQYLSNLNEELCIDLTDYKSMRFNSDIVKEKFDSLKFISPHMLATLIYKFVSPLTLTTLVEVLQIMRRIVFFDERYIRDITFTWAHKLEESIDWDKYRTSYPRYLLKY